MTLTVCLNRSVFLLFSLSRELSPFLLHEHVLSLLVSKLCILSLHSLYKFHVSCFVFSHFNSLPPASLSLLLHFNCDFHDYLTRSRLTCIKCPSGINLLRYQFCVHEGFFTCGIIWCLVYDDFLRPHIPHACLSRIYYMGFFVRIYIRVCKKMVIYLGIKTPQSRKERKYT